MNNTQRGSVLIISLIFLLLLTLIGVGSIQSSTLEEKMAGNSRQRSVAFQSAEAALRDAEWLLATNAGDAASEADLLNRFDAVCSAGLCASDDRSLTFTDGYWQNVGWDGGGPLGVRDFGANYAELDRQGRVDAAVRAQLPQTLGGVTVTPGYAIEAHRKLYAGLPDASYLYRITARGYGGDTESAAEPRSQVMLQEIYRPRR